MTVTPKVKRSTRRSPSRFPCPHGCNPWGWVPVEHLWRTVYPCPAHRATQHARWLAGGYLPQFRGRRVA